MSGQAATTTSGNMRFAIRIAGGALIPSFATIIFNSLNYIFDNYRKATPSEMSPATFDIAVGCAFAIFGICITSQNHVVVNKLQILLMVLIFLIIGGEMLIPAFFGVSKIAMITIVDIAAFVGLCWAIAVGDQP